MQRRGWKAPEGRRLAQRGDRILLNDGLGVGRRRVVRMLRSEEELRAVQALKAEAGSCTGWNGGGEKDIVMVAENAAGEDLCGYIIAWDVAGLELHVLDLAVVVDQRRQGVGTSLLEALEGRFPGRDVLLEVAQSNSSAIGLYESLGFSTESIRRGYYSSGEDALLMKKTSES